MTDASMGSAPNLQAAIDELHAGVEALTDQLGKLQERLRPITMPEYEGSDSGPEEAKNPMPSHSPLFEELIVVDRKIRGAINKVQYLQKQVQL